MGEAARSERVIFIFFNDTATTEIYTLSLHDALPIFIGLSLLSYAVNLFIFAMGRLRVGAPPVLENPEAIDPALYADPDRKSTRLNSSHANISYAVFCLKKKKKCLTL